MQVHRGMTDDWPGALGVTDPVAPDVTTDTIPASGGFVGHWYAGTNGYPLTKTAAVLSQMAGGLADQIDAICLKYCYADMPPTSGHTPAEVFADYKAMVDVLEATYPAVTVIKATETIVEETAAGDGPSNPLRMQYNDLVRAEWGSSGLLWDLARALSTDPEGNRITTVVEGQTVEHLYSGYASADQKHISGTGGIGRMAAAEPLLLILAGL